MNNYILLRNNKESGPYTFQDLRFYGISSTDLLWVEGESTEWLYPANITELAVIANEGQKRTVPERLEMTKPHTSFGSTVYTDSFPQEENNSSNYVADNASIYSTNKSRRKKSVSIGAGPFGFTVLLIGAGLCSFVVKKMVDGFDDGRFSATAEAKTIQEEVLIPSTTSHAAKMDNSIALIQSTPTPGVAIIESTPTKAAISKAAFVKPAADGKTAAVNDVAHVNGSSVEALIIAESQEEVLEKEKEEVPALSKPAPSLQVSANDYSVGVFGGISNLELSVTNPSSQVIEKATVEVEFLKPNGTVVKSQTISVENISPGGSKKIAVPSSSRGVKIRYKISGVQPNGEVATNNM